LAGRAATKTWNISRKGAKSAKKNESLVREFFCRVMLNEVKHLLWAFLILSINKDTRKQILRRYASQNDTRE
jgi:hypothetical protein